MVAAAAGPLAQMQFEKRTLPTRPKMLVTFGGAGDVDLMEGYGLVLACHEHSDDAAAIKAKDDLVVRALLCGGRLVLAERGPIRRVARALLERGRLTKHEVAELANT